jgi:hypothetical protein
MWSSCSCHVTIHKAAVQPCWFVYFLRFQARLALSLHYVPNPPRLANLHLSHRNLRDCADMVGISDLLDSDVEDQHHSDDNSDLSASSAEPQNKGSTVKKGRKRRGVTMPKARSRVTKTASAAPAKKPATRKTAAAKRKAAEEQIEDEDDEIQETQAPTPKPRGRAAGKKTVASEPVKEEAEEAIEESMEVDPSPAVARSSHAPARGGKALPKPVANDSAPVRGRKIAQTKNSVPIPLQEDELLDSDDDDEMQIDEPQPVRNKSRNNSRLATSTRRRGGSASDTERGDPNLRRKLGDITRKYENIEVKYRSLKDAGVSEANANIEKIRKQCDATTQASNELIASLKKELAQQAPLVQDVRKVKKQVQTNEQELAEMRKTNSTLSASLTSAQNEIKNLQARLAAARSTPAAENPKVPGSAMKQHSIARGGHAGLGESAQTAQMKEELYRDLTGLIVRSVKRSDEGDTYDCIQTGRNGSKSHFWPYQKHTNHGQHYTSNCLSMPKRPRQPASKRPSSCTRLFLMSIATPP